MRESTSSAFAYFLSDKEAAEKKEKEAKKERERRKKEKEKKRKEREKRKKEAPPKKPKVTKHTNYNDINYLLNYSLNHLIELGMLLGVNSIGV